MTIFHDKILTNKATQAIEKKQNGKYIDHGTNILLFAKILLIFKKKKLVQLVHFFLFFFLLKS